MRLGQSGGPREWRAGLAVGHQLDALEQAPTADLADVGVVTESGVEQPSQACALGGARLDQRLRLEDPQDLAGDSGADDMVREGEAMREAAALEGGRDLVAGGREPERPVAAGGALGRDQDVRPDTEVIHPEPGARSDRSRS